MTATVDLTRTPHLARIVAGRDGIDDHEAPRPHVPIELGDGSSISVQADRATYCLPRGNSGPYTHVEVEHLDCPYCVTMLADHGKYEEARPGTGAFAYVPVALVQAMIEAHQGER